MGTKIARKLLFNQIIRRLMETVVKYWAVWRVGSNNKLLCIEGKGCLRECVRFVEPRMAGAYAILPYEPIAEPQEADPCKGCDLTDTTDCYFCGRDPELI